MVRFNCDAHSFLLLILEQCADLLPSQSRISAFLRSVELSEDGSQNTEYPLSSHLHTPCLRIISRHPSLSTLITLVRVPSMPNGFQIRWFISYDTTASQLLSNVIESYGIPKFAGGSTVDYLLEIELNDHGMKTRCDPITPVFIPTVFSWSSRANHCSFYHNSFFACQ